MKKIILLGDSITELNPLKHEDILNLGIYGNTTMDIFFRTEQLMDLESEKIIFKAGINDILNGFSLEKSRDFYERILIVLQKKFKEIVLISVLPIENRSKINFKIRKLNKIIEKIAIKNNLKFLNLYPFFCDEKLNLKSDYSVDGIHLSSKGYEVLNNQILKII
ncbi:GDSL-type esterase/lipase family protein [uncultured Ilyobacter sp.]|uniref:GDSL-type esterase/lipase family protein n=1 Tax=uncultured Ilyobacter sp. TaxID=544433 RepID=UPI0029C8ECCA|nr:GDSL-type esterase/lipase family protein [uncultured Ilyobacter sp.]